MAARSLPANSATPAEAAAWLDDHGDSLFRYAIARVHDQDVAEDLVQETLLAAMLAHASFAGQCSLRTWLTAILKRKIVDHVRGETRGRTGARQARATTEAQLANWANDQFTPRGRWNASMTKWPADPADASESAELGRVLADCLEKLPPRVSEVFLLREREQRPAAELSKILSISTTNIGVILYRARLALRRCLELNWFDRSR